MEDHLKDGALEDQRLSRFCFWITCLKSHLLHQYAFPNFVDDKNQYQEFFGEVYLSYYSRLSLFDWSESVFFVKSLDKTLIIESINFCHLFKWNSTQSHFNCEFSSLKKTSCLQKTNAKYQQLYHSCWYSHYICGLWRLSSQ